MCKNFYDVFIALSYMTFDLLGIFRYSDPYFWSPFIVIGKDPMISFSDIRHSMLDQAIDEAERLYVKENCYDPLNPPSVLPNGNADIILNFNIIYSQLLCLIMTIKLVYTSHEIWKKYLLKLFSMFFNSLAFVIVQLLSVFITIIDY